VVALTGGPEGETLIRRTARIAARATGGEFMAVHVARSDGLAGSSLATLEKQRLLVESLGGSYHSVAGDRVAEAVLEFARANNATQIVIGASRRNPVIAGITGPGTGMTITRASGPIDVHVVSHDYIGRGRVLPRLSRGLTTRRRVAGLLTGGALLAILTPISVATRTDLSLASDMLLFLLVVVIATLVGGFYPALITAVAASLLINYYLVPPIHTFTINKPENVLAVVIFVVIAVLVSRVVDAAARRTSEAARSNAEAETLSTLAGSLLRGEEALPALLQRVQETFAVTSVSLLRHSSDAPASTAADRRNSSAGLRGTWTQLASVGDDACHRPEDGDTEVPVGNDLLLVLSGRALAAEDQRLLAAFASQVAVAYEQRRLADAAAAAVPLVETDRMRTALLNAVSHDLRTPIASAKAAVSGLRSKDISWTESDRDELLANADTALDRLTSLVTDLLDLSRVQAGVLTVATTRVALEDVVSRVLDHLGPSTSSAPSDAAIDVDIPTTLPEVQADPGLLERVVANLIDNALRYSAPHQRIRIAASGHGNTVELRIIDNGTGIPVEDRDAVFEPFQRRDDHATSSGAGVGLGLAIGRSFTEAMHGTLTLDDTPGGGLTAVIALPSADDGVLTLQSSTTDLLGDAGT
jgi:two-component system sensor histidine kinase KdpD